MKLVVFVILASIFVLVFMKSCTTAADALEAGPASPATAVAARP